MRSQGVQLATVEALLRYWDNDYDLARGSRPSSTPYRSSRPRSTGSASTSST